MRERGNHDTKQVSLNVQTSTLSPRTSTNKFTQGTLILFLSLSVTERLELHPPPPPPFPSPGVILAVRLGTADKGKTARRLVQLICRGDFLHQDGCRSRRSRCSSRSGSVGSPSPGRTLPCPSCGSLLAARASCPGGTPLPRNTENAS